jgi:RNA polymerase sigma-B factor
MPTPRSSPVAVWRTHESTTATERRIIALRFIDGLTQGEIGLTLGISQMHVLRLLARSLATLRDQMIADGG